jgi:hypothetical protein
MLQATVQAALARLADAGVSASVLERLASARYEVSALPPATLGLTSGNRVQVRRSRDPSPDVVAWRPGCARRPLWGPFGGSRAGCGQFTDQPSTAGEPPRRDHRCK